MLARLGAYLRQHHLGMLALFIALSGTAYAASLPADSVGTKQLKDGAVNSSKVRDGSLRKGDFGKGELPRGERGPQGKTGERGPRGKAGPRGKRGKRGKRGAAGRAGATNVTVRTAPLSVGVGPEAAATASCNGGERATGGGYDVESGGVTVQDSRPEPATGTPSGWHVGATATGAGQLTVYVICAAP
jgi:hypothetical protein